MSDVTQETFPDVGTPRPYALLPRLVLLELRKCVDTRAMRWVLWLTLLWGVGVATVACLYDLRTGQATSPKALLNVTMGVTTLPLSAISILVMSGDWTTRNTHLYFPRVRSRGAVFLAKVLTVILVAVGLAAVWGLYVAGWAWAAQVAGRVVRADVDAQFMAVFVVVILNSALVGAAVAALLRVVATSLAVVFASGTISLFILSLEIPNGLKLLLNTDTHLRPWLEPWGYQGSQFLPPASTVSAVVSGLVWVVVPLAVGAWLNHRCEA